jgi:hypothetical protein
MHHLAVEDAVHEHQWPKLDRSATTDPECLRSRARPTTLEVATIEEVWC